MPFFRVTGRQFGQRHSSNRAATDKVPGPWPSAQGAKGAPPGNHLGLSVMCPTNKIRSETYLPGVGSLFTSIAAVLLEYFAFLWHFCISAFLLSMRCEMHEESDELRPPALPHHRTATSSTFPRGEHLPKDSILALPSPCS